MKIKKNLLNIKNPNTNEWEEILAIQGEKGDQGEQGEKGDNKISYATCSTAADVAEKILTTADTDWKLEVGSMITVGHEASNTASNVTLNVNGTGAYPIWYDGSEYTSTSSTYTGHASRPITYLFDGTHWVWLNIGVNEAIDTDNLVVNNSISMGRKEDTTVGTGSVAVGYSTIASGENSHAEGMYTTAEGESSHAEGWYATASGESSHAEGANTTASGPCSHAEGGDTIASGEYSHAEGYFTVANGDDSHTEGYCTIASSENQHVQGKYNIEDTTGTYAHIVGNGTAEDARSNAHTLDWNGNAWFAGNVTIGADNKELATKDYVDEKAVQSDWNITDSTDPAFVQNKTHGESNDAWVIFADGRFNKTQRVNDQGYDYGQLWDCSVNITTVRNGEIFRITFEGQQYECQVTKKDKYFYFGNAAATGYKGYKSEDLSGIGNNEPFFCMMIPVGSSTTYCNIRVYTIATTLYDHYTFKVERKGTGTVKLDEKYLPESVGRQGYMIGAESFNYEYNESRGEYSHAEGYNTCAYGYYSHAEGEGSSLPPYELDFYSMEDEELIQYYSGSSIALGQASHVEGTNCVAIGNGTHAEGSGTIAKGSYSHAEGGCSKAIGDFSHAEGEWSMATGYISHAEGSGTLSSGGSGSHSEGSGTVAEGQASHAEGEGTIAACWAQHVEGRYNIKDTENKYAHIVGNGANDYTTNWEEIRSNAHTLDWDGNAWYAGNVYVGGISQDVGSKKLATEEYVDGAIDEALGGDGEEVIFDSAVDTVIADSWYTDFTGFGCYVGDISIEVSSNSNPYNVIIDDVVYEGKDSEYDAENNAWYWNVDGTWLYIHNQYEDQNKLVVTWDDFYYSHLVVTKTGASKYATVSYVNEAIAANGIDEDELTAMLNNILK